MVSITRKGATILRGGKASVLAQQPIPRPRKRLKPMNTCLNPEASVAGFVVTGCHCMICNHRRERS